MLSKEFTTMYRVTEESKKKQLKLPRYIDKALKIWSNQLNRTGSKSIILQELIATEYGANDSLTETEKFLNEQLIDFGYDINKIDNFSHEKAKKTKENLIEYVRNILVEDDSEDNYNKEELKEDVSTRKTYRFINKFLEQLPFIRGWNEKAEESVLNCLRKYICRSKRIKVKKEIIEYELADDDNFNFEYNEAEFLSGLEYDFNHLGDIINYLKHLDGWDERRKAIKQVYEENPVRKEKLFRVAFENSELSTERYYRRQFETACEEAGIYEYQRVPSVTPENLSEISNEYQYCEENRQEIIRSLLNYYRQKGNSAINTEKIVLPLMDTGNTIIITSDKIEAAKKLVEKIKDMDLVREANRTQIKFSSPNRTI